MFSPEVLVQSRFAFAYDSCEPILPDPRSGYYGPADNISGKQACGSISGQSHQVAVGVLCPSRGSGPHVRCTCVYPIRSWRQLVISLDDVPVPPLWNKETEHNLIPSPMQWDGGVFQQDPEDYAMELCWTVWPAMGPLPIGVLWAYRHTPHEH